MVALSLWHQFRIPETPSDAPFRTSLSYLFCVLSGSTYNASKGKMPVDCALMVTKLQKIVEQNLQAHEIQCEQPNQTFPWEAVYQITVQKCPRRANSLRESQSQMTKDDFPIWTRHHAQVPAEQESRPCYLG